MNGTIGLGALKAIDELGLKCPKDVALAVFDEVPKRRNPAAPPHRRGAACHWNRTQSDRTAVSAHAGKAPSEQTVIVLEPELKMRESTLPSGV